MSANFVPHETIESIYSLDPNFYPLEITRSLRDIDELDATGASLTLEAAIQLEANGGWTSIEEP